MTHRIVGSLVASLAAAAVFAGSASAIPTADEEPWGTDDAEYLAPDAEYETVESDPGIVCAAGGEPIAAALASSGPSTLLASLDGSSISASEGDACASGAYRPSCRRIEVKVRKRTAFRISLAFEWVVEKTWCWDYPKVTWHSVRAYPTHINAYMRYRGIVGSSDSHFTWCCFSSRSGHRTYRMGWFENCIPFKGCIGAYYPRVRVETYGNGSYRVTDKGV
jgi:hypothetical protein